MLIYYNRKIFNSGNVNNLYIPKNRFFTKFEPSLGINISYLDFDTEKDIEIGAGTSIGLFNNLIQFTVGYNLNVERNNIYWGIGFSFINIAEKIKSL